MPKKKIIENVEEIPEILEETIENAIESIKEVAEGNIEKKIERKKKTSKKDIEEKDGKKISRKELEKKAKKLAEKITQEEKTEKLKEKLEKERQPLVDTEDYVKSGIYIGTKVITPHVRPFVYRRRNDGIAVIDMNIIDDKLKELIRMISKYEPNNFIVVCKREAGWKAVKKFSELTGVRIFTKKYPAGILTNINLPNFFETDMVFICDPWIDKNALNDSNKIKKPVLALCDTNNYTFGIDFFVPCNNKSNKSLGLIFYILTKEYLKAKGIDKEVKLIDFVDEW